MTRGQAKRRQDETSRDETGRDTECTAAVVVSLMSPGELGPLDLLDLEPWTWEGLSRGEGGWKRKWRFRTGAIFGPVLEFSNEDGELPRFHGSPPKEIWG
ncbi:hypothetical protein J7T55_015656 [Diaporthe amygdali]|uniref:uncharacterized protein n=1 Tax=Phomopsis amygdali TaxID=1214568 RepID=UPI0022FE5585|nr:uncharacterized protein J7T55_015656 [Diaporthe amygdali]KAJ0120918.1 hypothetical protein J7T55_015656 [Diaporthe amygdali]